MWCYCGLTQMALFVTLGWLHWVSDFQMCGVQALCESQGPPIPYCCGLVQIHGVLNARGPAVETEMTHKDYDMSELKKLLKSFSWVLQRWSLFMPTWQLCQLFFFKLATKLSYLPKQFKSRISALGNPVTKCLFWESFSGSLMTVIPLVIEVITVGQVRLHSQLHYMTMPSSQYTFSRRIQARITN
ncbi:unnamed protein product [Sphagnum jensenii]|uniref:Uncharacterized protein n=1 Tax=Sphagnum jensenii TaxID=128206 RepID=A0ABP0XKQ0_9BRYO